MTKNFFKLAEIFTPLQKRNALLMSKISHTFSILINIESVDFNFKTLSAPLLVTF